MAQIQTSVVLSKSEITLTMDADGEQYLTVEEEGRGAIIVPLDLISVEALIGALQTFSTCTHGRN